MSVGVKGKGYVSKKLLLVDLEIKHKVNLSPLDESFRAIIFVGANQNPPKAAKKPAKAHRFSRVDFLKISGTDKNGSGLPNCL